MAGLPKRPAEGELRGGGFVSVGPNGDNLDPLFGPPSGSQGLAYRQDPYANKNGSWEQVDRGARDNSGSRHDW